jgi:hypothetical protein
MVRKLTLDEVKKTFSDQKCILISTEYIKARGPLQYICNCGSETIHTVKQFKQSLRSDQHDQTVCNYDPIH